MKTPCWKPGLTPEEERDIAYQERNLLALLFADGWYYDTDNNWEGWKRVLSLKGGSITFHIPDDFDVGILREIKPNWDGHTTKEKWTLVMNLFAIDIEDENNI